MSRPLRIEYEGAWYHVMNRGRGREVVFPDDEGYQVFLDTVGEAVGRFGAQVHSYCLMPNHYHLLVHTPWGNLGRVMRHIDGLYTQRHNRRFETDGPLFRGRYKAILVDADAYLLSVSRYIHRNPVDAAAPLVERLEDWPWSSYPAYIRAARPPDWLERETTLAQLGRRNRFAAYRAFVAGGVEDDVAAFYANRRATPILGDEGFREWALKEAPQSSEVAQPSVRPPKTLEQVLTAVAREWGLSRATLTARGGQRSVDARVARQMAMRVCRDETGLTLAQIGEVFGGIHYSAVSQNIRRLQQRLDAERPVYQAYYSILSRLDR